MSRTTSRLAAILTASAALAAGCTAATGPASAPVDPVDSVEAHVTAEAPELPAPALRTTLAGYAPNVDCDQHRRHPITLDPSWPEDLREVVRAAALQWEGAVGVNLGSLPVSAVDCSRETPVVGCIAMLDYHYSPSDDTTHGDIRVYTRAMVDAGSNSLAALAEVVAHEVGHYLGIHTHGGDGVMGASVGGASVVGQDDIDLYAEACVL